MVGSWFAYLPGNLICKESFARELFEDFSYLQYTEYIKAHVEKVKELEEVFDF